MAELTKMLGGTCRDFVAVRPFSEIPPPALFRPVGPAFLESAFIRAFAGLRLACQVGSASGTRALSGLPAV